LTKAFDRVRLSDIINILIAKETPDTIVRAVCSLNMNNMTKVKAGDTYTEEIPTPGGIRQGDRMLRVAEMKTLGTIMGKTRIYRIRNTDIREQEEH